MLRNVDWGGRFSSRAGNASAPFGPSSECMGAHPSISRSLVFLVGPLCRPRSPGGRSALLLWETLHGLAQGPNQHILLNVFADFLRIGSDLPAAKQAYCPLPPPCSLYRRELSTRSVQDEQPGPVMEEGLLGGPRFWRGGRQSPGLPVRGRCSGPHLPLHSPTSPPPSLLCKGQLCDAGELWSWGSLCGEEGAASLSLSLCPFVSVLLDGREVGGSTWASDQSGFHRTFCSGLLHACTP